MSNKVKLIVNAIATALYGVALFSFFTDNIYVWILGIGKAGSYKGYEVALNFDGMPTNLGTLFPMLVCLGIFIYGLIAVIKGLIGLKKEPKKNKKYHPLLCAIIFGLFPLVTFFLTLSTSAMLNLPAPKRYGGYYMGVGVYLTAYFSLVAGIMFFITESGIFAKKDDEPLPEVASTKKVEPSKAPVEAKKEEAKPAPVATKVAPQANSAAPKAQKAPIKLRCKRCGEIFLSNEKKCPKCGADVNPNNMVKLIPTAQAKKPAPAQSAAKQPVKK